MIEQIKNKIYECKLSCVRIQDWESASNLRDVERELLKIIDGDVNLENFIKYINRRKYNNFNQIYEIIKPLERNLKLQKIEKLHNKS